jgi:hypothetical protein
MPKLGARLVDSPAFDLTLSHDCSLRFACCIPPAARAQAQDLPSADHIMPSLDHAAVSQAPQMLMPWSGLFPHGVNHTSTLIATDI